LFNWAVREEILLANPVRNLKERRIKAVNILDQIERISTSISTGEGFGGKGNDLSSGYNWWRCRDLNPATS
jgi:hypothetical protein